MKTINLKGALALLLPLLFWFACGDDNMTIRDESIKKVKQEQWDNLAKKKIYFGHQSVGYNIMDGVEDVLKQNQKVMMNIAETHQAESFDAPIFAHSTIGKNNRPNSKIKDFKKFMDDGIGAKADYAFFKFCYVDITPQTDVNAVFDTYKETMARLSKAYNDTKFIHVTVPLLALQTGPKAWIKKLIGKPLSGYDDNVIRTRLNELLLKEYQGKEPIFDLAKMESTLPNGERREFQKDGKAFPALMPAYTDDGGHLNEIGRRRVAEQLLVFLAGLSN